MISMPASGPDPSVFHRPADAAGLRAAALELARQGLTCRDVATALRISEPAVRALLGGSTP